MTAITLPRPQVGQVLDALLSILPSKDRPLNVSSKTRYALAKNVRLFTSRFQEMERERLKIVRALAPETFTIDKEKEPEKGAEYTRRWEAYQAAQDETLENAFRVKLSDLNIYDPKDNPSGNDIPIAVLAKLGPIIIEDDAVA